MNLWEFVAKCPLTPMDYSLYSPYSFSCREEAEAERFTRLICASLGYKLEAHIMSHTYGLCVMIYVNQHMLRCRDNTRLKLGAWPKALALACTFIGGAKSAEEVMLKLDLLAKEGA